MLYTQAVDIFSLLLNVLLHRIGTLLFPLKIVNNGYQFF